MCNIGGLGLEEICKPKSFSLTWEGHILICDTSHIDCIKKHSDLIKGSNLDIKWETRYKHNVVPKGPHEVVR